MLQYMTGKRREADTPRREWSILTVHAFYKVNRTIYPQDTINGHSGETGQPGGHAADVGQLQRSGTDPGENSRDRIRRAGLGSFPSKKARNIKRGFRIRWAYLVRDTSRKTGTDNFIKWVFVFGGESCYKLHITHGRHKTQPIHITHNIHSGHRIQPGRTEKTQRVNYITGHRKSR